MRINNKQLLNNIALSLGGQVLPTIIAVLAVPYTIKGLGVERFGIFSLARIIFDYFLFFDLGLGKATTKFVSGALNKDDMRHIPSIIWTSITIQSVLGIAAGLILVIITPLLTDKILKIPFALASEAKQMLYILSPALFLAISCKSLRGALEAKQRFDLINLIQIPSSCLIFLLPVVGIIMGMGLTGIMLLISTIWLFGYLFYLLFCFKVFPVLNTKNNRFCIHRSWIKPLLSFGGWVSAGNIIIPFLVYSDRLLIASIVSVGALTYYVAPYELVSRLFVIPSIICMVLFPVFGNLSSKNLETLKQFYARSLRYTSFVLGIVFIGMSFFSEKIMKFWLGANYLPVSATILQVLSLGLFLNSVAQIPANIIDAVGRPDLRIKIYLTYLFLYLGLAWFLVLKFNILGAAYSWVIRAGVEAIIFSIVAKKLLKEPKKRSCLYYDE